VDALTPPRQAHTCGRCDGHGPYHNQEAFSGGCLDVSHHTISEAMKLECE